ncbi:hypothetical protein ANO11243_073540 [Dothideomycetidae sp. 11243]|nr:hypothetical protein ANO11243_073540 [fungal sp. No.11243]
MSDSTMSKHLIQGMTCTGCEKKLRRAMEGTPGISQVKISFLNSWAECELDDEIISAEEAVLRIRKKTGFSVIKTHKDYQTVKVYSCKHRGWESVVRNIVGVKEFQMLDRSKAKLTYDPEVVGLRDLLSQMAADGTKLVPTSIDHEHRPMTRLQGPIIKTMLSAILTIPVAVLSFGQTTVDRSKQTAVVILLLATLVQLIAVTEFYHKAVVSLIHEHVIELDMLIVLSIKAAYAYSAVAFGYFMAGTPLVVREFFATSTLLITLVLLGRLMADIARTKAVQAVSMKSLQETTAEVVDDDGNTTQIDARLLQYGDCFAIKPHERIPTDGVVTRGQSAVDEATLTGESMPVFKIVGDQLTAGTINGDGSMVAELTRLPGKNTITDIGNLVEQANNNRPKVQDLADRLASWFIPIVLTAALIAFGSWLAIDLLVNRQTTAAAVANAITYSIAVLAVSCPCALGLAVPIVLVITGGIAARTGVIVKSGAAIETSWQVTDVIFDKTGTLTLPDLEVTDEVIARRNQKLAISIAQAMVKSSHHPISVSLNRHFSSLPCSGISAKLDGAPVSIGSPRWLGYDNDRAVCRLIQENKTVVCVSRSRILLAVFGLQAKIRPEAPSLVQQLQKRGITIHLLSGDTDQANCRSRCEPAAKQSYVLSLFSPGCRDHCMHDSATLEFRPHNHQPRSKRKVLFVGDGTNDALALTSAHIGVQVGTASDVLSSTASVSLLGPLTGILDLLDLSRAAYRRIIFNFVWAAVYNVFAILLASGAAVEWRIPPRYAGIGELVSVLPVVAVGASMMFLRKR